MDRLPPSNVEKEQEILASAIINYDNLCLLMSYPGEMFYHEHHKIIYSAIKDLFEIEPGSIDLSMITSQLRKTNQYDQTNNTLHEIITSNTLLNMKFNLNFIYQLAGKRKMLILADEFKHELIDVDEFVDRSIMIKDELEDINHRIENPNMDEFIDRPFDEIFSTDDYLTTGIKEIDKKLIGLFPTQVVLIAARPGEGKTTLAWQITQNLGQQYRDREFLYFSYEMTKSQMYAKTISAKCDIPTWKIQSGKLWDSERKIILEVHEKLKDNMNIEVFSKSYNVFEIANIVKTKSRKKQIGGIIIDYIQRMPKTKGNNMNEQTGIISNKLKDIALDYDIPVITLSQLSRANEKANREPILSDLRDSGTLEQDADVVMFLHSEDKDTLDEENFIIFAKNRINKTGRLVDMNGKSLVKFNKPFNRFEAAFIESAQVPEFNDIPEIPGVSHE